MKSTVFINVPAGFSFRSTVYSHGWCELAPFELDEETWRLSYVFRGPGGSALPALISQDGDQIRVDVESANIDPVTVAKDTRHLLRLDDDLDGFYAAIDGNERLRWVAERRAGRLLRSATVFE